MDLIFHGGDIHDLRLLDELEALAPVYAARGNGEDGSGGRPTQPEDSRVQYAWFVTPGGALGRDHPLRAHSRTAAQLHPGTLDRPVSFRNAGRDVIVSGDTHRELIAEVDGVLCVNPGSPTYPHNYDTQFGTLGFLELADGSVSASVHQITEDGIEPFDWEGVPPWKRP